MQKILESILKLESLAAGPPSARQGKQLQLVREAISARLRAASQADAPFFRKVVLALVALPAHVSPETRVELILDIAQYCYFAGLPFEAIDPLKEAEALARASNQLPLVYRAANSLGVIYADTGNVSNAIEKYSQALEVAQKLGDVVAEAKTWGNIGVALHYGADYKNAIACYRRVVKMAQDSPSLKPYKISALSNIALTSLHSGEYTLGLRAARRALAEVEEPQSPAQMVSRVLLEKNAASLLIEIGELKEAKVHVEQAKYYADLSKSSRAKLEASIAEGLYLVHNGTYDLGLSRLSEALEKARSLRSAFRDVLVALVKAYEFMGQPDRALVYLRELMEHTRNFQQDNTLRHLKLQLKNVEADLERTQSTLMRHEELLRGKLAEQEIFKVRTEILERLADIAERASCDPPRISLALEYIALAQAYLLRGLPSDEVYDALVRASGVAGLMRTGLQQILGDSKYMPDSPEVTAIRATAEKLLTQLGPSDHDYGRVLEFRRPLVKPPCKT